MILIAGSMNIPDIESIRGKMKKCNRIRQLTNMSLCLVIVLLGITSIIYKVRYEGGFFTCFREMTVCATFLTTLSSAVFILLNLYQVHSGSEISSEGLFFFRLSNVVAAAVVPIVTLIGFLPFFSDHPVILRYDMFNMHLLIPLMTIAGFIFNDSAIGHVLPRKLFRGLIVLLVYAAVMFTLIMTNVIPENKIPYSFLNVRNQPVWFPVLAFFLILGIGYLLSWAFYRLNLKMSWLWYRRVAVTSAKVKK